MQKLNVFITPEACRQEHENAAVVIVIDVLRASSTIVTAFANGCRRIYPVEHVAAAFKKVDELERRNVILGGEREGYKVQGFDLGNSPREYSREVISGKDIVFTTTNGTKALQRCAAAEKTIVLSFLNLGAVTRCIGNTRGDINIVCAGDQGDESPEDCACAGVLIHRLSNQGLNHALNETAQYLFDHSIQFEQRILSFLTNCEHGISLKKIGYAADVEFCAQTDKYDVLPVFQNGIIMIWPE